MFRRLISLVAFPIVWAVRVGEHRQVLAMLAEMDDRGLADIGLMRQDLRDVSALPLGADPTRLLAARALSRKTIVKSRRAAPPDPAVRIAAE